MSTRAGVTKTAKEALICKSSSSLLTDDSGGLQKPRMGDGDGVRCRRQNPLLNRIYVSRNQIIHKMIRSCLGMLKSHGVDAVLRKSDPQLLLLGAGVDVTFERLYSKSATIFAVDYAEIMLEREAALSVIHSKKGSEVCESCFETNRSSLICADLCDFSDLWTKLIAAGFDKKCPTIVLIECVLCYIDSSSVQKLLKQLSNHLPQQSILITYDPMVPKPSINFPLSAINTRRRSDFAQMIADKFTERNAPIQHNIKSTEMQEKFQKSCGWQYVRAVNMYTASRSILTRAERQILILAEPFDEFASLAMLHKLYNVSLASLSEQLFLSCLNDLNLNKGYIKQTSLCSKLPYSNDAAGRINQCNQPINKDESTELLQLMQRISILELRLQSIIVRKASKNIVTYRGLTCRIRTACDLDSEAIITLYTECFLEQATKYAAVRKFVKKSVKSLSTLSTEFSEKLGSNFWVAEVKMEDKGVSDEGVNMCIIGCIGLKATTAVIDWSQAASSDNQQLAQVRMIKGSEGSSEGIDSTTNSQECRGEISHMCVAKSHRGKGIARVLLDHLLNYARPAPASASCRDHNKPHSDISSHDRCNGLQSRFHSLDLTVLCDLTAAKTLYLSKEFTDQGPPCDLGHGCFLQHMSLSTMSSANTYT